MKALYSLLSFLPILLLLIICTWKGVKTGIYTSFIVTVVLFFIWGSTVMTFLASIFSAFVGTLNILMIIFGAVFLYHTMEQKGYISGIQHSLSAIHPDKSFRFFFLAFFLTAFFESVSGFGTPMTIVPLLLITMGFTPVLSISVVLLIDCLFSLAGAVGTPVSAGLEIPLQLSASSVSHIYLYSTFFILFAGFVILFFIIKFFNNDAGANNNNTKTGMTMYLIAMIPFFAFSYFMKELSGLMASIFMAIFAYFFLFKNRNLQWKPWLPYWVLVVLLLIPKLFTFIAPLLAYNLQFFSIFGTEVNTSLQPLKSPLIPFLAASLFALYHAKDYSIDLKPVVSKTFAVFLILFPSLAITQLMLYSGSQMPSMIDMLAGIFVKAGSAYILVSPYIGMLGAFISGSTTVSNIIFGSVQNTAALQLGVQKEIILSLQLTGASLGNAVCLFNIIAAAAVTGTKEYSMVLRKNIIPVLLASIVCSLLAYLLLQF